MSGGNSSWREEEKVSSVDEMSNNGMELKKACYFLG